LRHQDKIRFVYVCTSTLAATILICSQTNEASNRRKKNEKRENKSKTWKIDWSINSNWQNKKERNNTTHSFQHLLHLKNENLIHPYTDLNLAGTKQNVCLFENKKSKLYFLSIFIAVWYCCCHLCYTIGYFSKHS